MDKKAFLLKVQAKLKDRALGTGVYLPDKNLVEFTDGSKITDEELDTYKDNPKYLRKHPRVVKALKIREGYRLEQIKTARPPTDLDPPPSTTWSHLLEKDPGEFLYRQLKSLYHREYHREKETMVGMSLKDMARRWTEKRVIFPVKQLPPVSMWDIMDTIPSETINTVELKISEVYQLLPDEEQARLDEMFNKAGALDPELAKSFLLSLEEELEKTAAKVYRKAVEMNHPYLAHLKK